MRKLAILALLLIVPAVTTSQVREHVEPRSAALLEQEAFIQAPAAAEMPMPEVPATQAEAIPELDEGPCYYYAVSDLGVDTKGRQWEAWKQSRSACEHVNYLFVRDGIEIARINDVWERIGWPCCRLVSWAGLDFIVLKQTGTTGTGCWLTMFKWYLIADGQATCVLELPGVGHVQGWGLEFDRDFELSWIPLPGGTPRVRISVSADWYLAGDESWCLQSRLEYELHWNAKTRQFVPTQAGRWRDPWDFWNCAHDEFVLNHQAEIRAAVASREARYGDWLEAMRTKCKDPRAIELIEVWQQELAG